MESAENYVVNRGLGVILHDLGIEAANLLRRADLRPDLFASDSAKLTQQQYFSLWNALEAESTDTPIPLRMAPVLTLEAFDPPIFAAVCSPNLASAAQRIARYKRLIGPMGLRVDLSPHALTLEYQWPEGVIPPRILAAAELTFWVALARLATRHNVKPLQVATYEPPAEQEQYGKYMGVRIVRGDSQRIRFSHEDALRPFVTARAGMWDVFEPELQRRIHELDTPPSMTELVRSTLLELLPAGQSSIRDVARTLAVSTRTLQRKLNDEDTSFQKVLNATRESLAKHYLSNTRLSLPEVSFLVGYEEPNSFYRAFRVWTGTTPDAVRSSAIQ